MPCRLADTIPISSMSVRSFIVKFLCLGLVVLILDKGTGRVLKHFYFRESSGQHYRTTVAMEKTVAEVLVFGSSRASRHYVPEVISSGLGMTCYNTGMEGNGVFYQLAVLRSVLKRHTPEIVILDFDGIASGGDNQVTYDSLSSLLPYYDTHAEIRNIVELRGPYERFKVYSGIYPFNSQLLKIIAGNLERNKIRQADDRGYLPLRGKWDGDTQPVVKCSDGVDRKRHAAYSEFMELCAGQGIKLFVVLSPSYVLFCGGPDLQAHFRDYISKGVCFVDFKNDAIFSSPSLYNDPGHLNHQGALIFSKLLVDRIQSEMHTD